MFNVFRAPLFGLDISDYSIEMVSLKGTTESPKLLAMGRVKIEQGIVEDGKILDREKLKQYLKDLIENPEFGRIKTRKIIFLIPESKSYIHIFELPKVQKKEEILELVKSQIETNFPFTTDELYFDFQVRPPARNGGREILLVAVPKNIVNDYLEIFKECNLKPSALEIESLSLARALISELTEKKSVLIADIGARTANLSIFDKEGLRLSFSIPVAGNRFTQAIAEKLNISRAEAESLKKRAGLNPKIQEGKVFLILQKEIQGIIEEISKIKKYFQQRTSQKIEKIILAGGSATLPSFPQYLTENLDIPVEISDPWVKINIDILKKKEFFKRALRINPVLYSAAIGAALRGLSKESEKVGINLLKGRI